MRIQDTQEKLSNHAHFVKAVNIRFTTILNSLQSLLKGRDSTLKILRCAMDILAILAKEDILHIYMMTVSSGR